ncbi:MAG: aldose 1-epimerase, partial [Burkholderiales bacterium]|nr:aldose 1-epimerase [Burkholderiales bacterium]
MTRLAAGDAEIELAPQTGGAIAAFTLLGEPILRSTPDDARTANDVRRHACYPLIPYSNRIALARLSWSGRTHDLARNFGDSPHAIHGIGWQRAWSVASRSTDTALLTLDHDGSDTTAWPWPFRAT